MISESLIVDEIIKETAKRNLDNITRTEAYFNFFKRNPDIIWSFLASMVSRNGGWNMCDLEGNMFPHLLSAPTRKQLFLTYERANWLIFHDVFPQLLLYHYSTKYNRPLFHLLKHFNVSSFMQKEWPVFWKGHDKQRLTTALIINEQNVIQKPIIEHPFYKQKVFYSAEFMLQDWLHFSCVLFPTCGGEVYGASVKGFRKVSNRIDLGKRLAKILFHRRLFPYFLEFANKTVHTGSRYDYEQYFRPGISRQTPFLRTVFPIIEHNRHEYTDWSKEKLLPYTKLFLPVKQQEPIHLTDWYIRKRDQLQSLVAIQKALKPNS
ncbi:DUF2515 domain-containing protein [Neobacillus notoginsengisoli]|uniref:DUF2515 domain-containing protein n=1 Tax=Neobacillus notoginsengisoli TaxID=1578198 RepID=A0A417YVF6_9BACI|nr:DUF2515 domain-containing protein [Neobacillus notoginsengisoli]RHW41284.1 DUF2515 domain-containing protein [Neobacillus notoginsengisoli]